MKQIMLFYFCTFISQSAKIKMMGEIKCLAFKQPAFFVHGVPPLLYHLNGTPKLTEIL